MTNSKNKIANLIGDPDDFRERLLLLLQKHPKTMIYLSKEIGISAGTLGNFINEKRKLSFQGMFLVGKYLRENES